MCLSRGFKTRTNNFSLFPPAGVTAPSISLSSSLFSLPKWWSQSSWPLVSLDGVSGRTNSQKHLCQNLFASDLSHVSLPLSGWIVSLAALNYSVAVGAIMMMNALLFTAQAAIGVFMLKKVKTKHICSPAGWQFWGNDSDYGMKSYFNWLLNRIILKPTTWIPVYQIMTQSRTKCRQTNIIAKPFKFN